MENNNSRSIATNYLFRRSSIARRKQMYKIVTGNKTTLALAIIRKPKAIDYVKKDKICIKTGLRDRNITA